MGDDLESEGAPSDDDSDESGESSYADEDPMFAADLDPAGFSDKQCSALYRAVQGLIDRSGSGGPQGGAPPAFPG